MTDIVDRLADPEKVYPEDGYDDDYALYANARAEIIRLREKSDIALEALKKIVYKGLRKGYDLGNDEWINDVETAENALIRMGEFSEDEAYRRT